MSTPNKRKEAMEDNKSPKRPKMECPYGDKCFRLNPIHFKEYSHAHLEFILDSYTGNGDFPVPSKLNAQKQMYIDQLKMILHKQLYSPGKNFESEPSTRKPNKAAPQDDNPSVASSPEPTAPRVDIPSVAPLKPPAAPRVDNPSVAASNTSAAPQVSNQGAATGSTIDLFSMKAAMPIPTSSIQDGLCWDLVGVKKRGSKVTNPPNKTRKTKRAKPQSEAKRARPLASGGSKQLEAAEGFTMTHVVPISDALTHGKGNSLTEGTAAPTSMPPDAKKLATVTATPRQGHTRIGNRAGIANQAGKPSGQTLPAKRNHPDESLTPQGGFKRHKSQLTTTGSTSYSDALKSNDYCVAVMLEPYHDLTKEQAEAIEVRLLNVLDAEIFAPRASGALFVAPQYRGKAFHSEGVLKMWCKDDFALQWLHQAVVKVDSPRVGTRLVVKRQSEIPKRIKAGLLVPHVGPEDTLDRIRMRLMCQNSYKVSNWALYHAEPQEEKKCVFLVLGIPEEDASRLKVSERRVFYQLGNLYVRFLDDRPRPGEAQPGPSKGSSVRTSPAKEDSPEESLSEEVERGLDEAMLRSNDGAASSPQL